MKIPKAFPLNDIETKLDAILNNQISIVKGMNENFKNIAKKLKGLK